MRRGFGSKRVLGGLLLTGATVAVFATEWLAFMWPIMALIDAQVAFRWRRRRRITA